MAGISLKHVRRTTTLVYFYAAILAGVGIAYSGFSITASLSIASLPLLALCVFRPSLVGLLLACCIGVAIGCSRGAIYNEQHKTYQSYFGQKLMIEVTANDDAIYGYSGQLEFTGTNVVIDGQHLAGKLQISGFGMQAIYQGDRIIVYGKLRETMGAAQGRMSYAKLELLAHQPSLIGHVRRTFAAGMSSALPEPLASFSLGLLLGKRTTIPQYVKDDLLMVGLTHIVAVSGYNLTILLNASKSLLARHSKKLNTLLSLTLVAVFLMLTGASASIVRAAIISVISIAIAYYGRTIKPVHVILLAAAITGWLNPFYVWKDMGWYLSFLAFYGILVIAPIFKSWLSERWSKSLIASVAVESMSAEIITLPFVVHFFGQISMAGLPANLLVVTFVPFAMLTSFIAGLAGIFIAPVAGWLAWPATTVLNYMLDIARLIAGLPNVFHENIELTLQQMIGCYIFIFAYTLLLSKKTNIVKPDKITD